MTPHQDGIPAARYGSGMGVLDYAVTIDRALVHRWSIAEVFLTDLRCAGPGEVRAAAQWPRQHPYFDAGDRTYCLLMAAETFRQCTIAALHDTGLAADDDLFVMRRMAFAWVGEPPAIRDRPLDLAVSLVMTPGPRAGRYDLQVTISDLERELVTGSGVVVVLRPPVYAALRRGRTDPRSRVDPDASITSADVARTRPQDVVLTGPHTGPWELRVDTTHPTLFDHPSDHVPGMLLLEAARQAALLGAGGRRVVSIDADFGAYLELDAATTVELTPEARDGAFAVTVRQGETRGAHVAVTVGP